VLIILCLYLLTLWLLFSKFKVVRWGWLTGKISVSIGALILATSGAVQLFDAFRQGHSDRKGRRSNAKRKRPERCHSSEAERAGKERGRSLSNRPSSVPV
jgi:hypothetical protein